MIGAMNIAVPYAPPPTRRWDRGWGDQLPTVETRGGGPRRWSRGVDSAALARGAQTMGEFDLGIFQGCTNRARVASYMTALRFESTIQGFVAGAATGAVLASVVGLYLISKGSR